MGERGMEHFNEAGVRKKRSKIRSVIRRRVYRRRGRPFSCLCGDVCDS
jgi:hypothetical protein